MIVRTILKKVVLIMGHVVGAKHLNCWPTAVTSILEPNQALLTATTTIFYHTIVIGIILYCIGKLMYLENKPQTIEYVYIILVL